MSDARFMGRTVPYVLAAVALVGTGVFATVIALGGEGVQWVFLAIAVFAFASSAFLGYLANFLRWAHVSDLGMRLGATKGKIIPWASVVSVIFYRRQSDFVFVVEPAPPTRTRLMLFHASRKASPALAEYLRTRLGPTKVVVAD